jgi:hypothetical protein
MIGAIAGDIIGSRFEGHPAPPAALLAALERSMR